METVYSKEYIAKLIMALVSLLVTVLPIFGIDLSGNDRDLAIGSVEGVAGMIVFLLTLFTMFRQKAKEGLTALGRVRPMGPRGRAMAQGIYHNPNS